jgi:acetyltransferase-like isoleucine patch superfamily enzyme
MSLTHNYSVEGGGLVYSAKLGRKAFIRRKNQIYGVQLGDYSYISGPYSLVHDCRIGNFTSIGRGCMIGLHNHRLDAITTSTIITSKNMGFITSAPKSSSVTTTIGNDVWIGANVMVIAGVKIGDGAIIGAGSIITKNVEAFSVVAGVPAKRVRWRFEPQVINKLKKLEWWYWPDAQIKEHINLFYDIEGFVEYFPD